MSSSLVRALGRWPLPAVVLAAFLSATLMVGSGAAQEKKGGGASPAAKPDGGKAKGGKAGAPKTAPRKAGTKGGAAKPARSKAPVANPGAAPSEDVSFIAPYIGEKTFAVARIDPAHVDLDALDQYVTALAASDRQVAQHPNSKRFAAGMIKSIRTAVTELQRAGEKHVYVLFEHDDNPVDGGALLVTPVPARIEHGIFSDLLNPFSNALGSVPRREWSETDGAVLYGSPVQVGRAKERRAADGGDGGGAAAGGRDRDLAEAFGVAAAANAPLRVALKPGEPARQFLRAALPDLPPGTEQRLTSLGDRWLTLAFTQKPEPLATVTARAGDPDRAAAAAAWMAEVVERQSKVGVPAWGKNAVARQGDTVTFTTHADGIVLQFLAATRRNLARNPVAGAGPPPAGPGKPPAAFPVAALDDKRIIPFVSDDTVAVARIDLARVDLDALQQFTARVVDEEARAPGADPAKVAAEKNETAASLKRFEASLAAFRAAGAGHLYVVVERGDLNKDNPKPMFVVPFDAAEAFPKLSSALMRLRRDPELMQTTGGEGAAIQATKEQFLRVSKQTLLAKAGRGAIADRPDLLAALAAGGDAPFRIAFVPGEAARQQIEQSLPPLPGGADAKLLSRGIRWATLSFTQKPGMGLGLTARASDEANAKSLVALAGEMLSKTSGVAPEAVEQLIQRNGETLTLTTDERPVLQGVVAARRMAGMIAAQKQAQPPAAPPAAPEGDGLD
jgi:hypothetical protein